MSGEHEWSIYNKPEHQQRADNFRSAIAEFRVRYPNVQINDNEDNNWELLKNMSEGTQKHGYDAITDRYLDEMHDVEIDSAFTTKVVIYFIGPSSKIVKEVVDEVSRLAKDYHVSRVLNETFQRFEDFSPEALLH